MFGALKRGFRSTASLILVRNVVGVLQPKRILAASRGFLAEARLSCYSGSLCTKYRSTTQLNAFERVFTFIQAYLAKFPASCHIPVVYVYSSKMARKANADKELDDMTECSICTEEFTDSRVLPCIHTFCLKCLVNYGKDRQPGDLMPCPLCRKEFAIPDDGLPGIQKNFFMDKLIHVRKISAGEKASPILCDMCSSDEGRKATEAAGAAKPAVMHCFQCQQNYCERCSWSHTRVKSTAEHVQVEIGKKLQMEEIALKLPMENCDRHPDKLIELFCHECRLAICMMCFVKSHKSHDCLDIEEVSVDLRKQVSSDRDKAAELLEKAGRVLPRFDQEKKDFVKHLADIEDDINTAADKLIDAVQRDRAKLLSEVESIKVKRIKQLEMARQEVEQHMAALEIFKRYSETLLSSGTSCGVTRSADSLHNRADELARFDVIGHVDRSLNPVVVNFTSSTVLDTAADNLIGNIAEKGLVFTARCTLVQSAVLRSHVVCLSVRLSVCL